MSFASVSIIGSGNLALHLAKNLEQVGIRIRELAGRNEEKISKITSQLYAVQPVLDFDLSESISKVYFLCITDAAIAEVSYRLRLPENALLVHCSGATSIEVLRREDCEIGVFYPVQTFSATRKISFKSVPICIEASTEEGESILEAIAKKLSATPCFMTSEQRLKLHLSAVFACNFSNHLFLIAQKLLDEEGLPLALLNPLILETVHKALEIGPEKAQTGPALRKDYATMDKHLALLSDHPEWKDMYTLFSDKIRKQRE